MQTLRRFLEYPLYSISFIFLLSLFSVPYDSLLRIRSPSTTHLHHNKNWTVEAIRKLWEERERMGYTPLVKMKLPSSWKVSIFLKNESASRTESVKHRYAWSLFMWAVNEGHLQQDTLVVEASSGNSACSEAYMARLLGLPFIAVVPDTLEKSKEGRIVGMGGSVVRVPLARRLEAAREIARQRKAFFMNQFANADRAEEFHLGGHKGRESSNMMSEIMEQLNTLKLKPPSWFVHAAGTGGTISSVGRLVRKYGINTKTILADTEYSVYGDYVVHGGFTQTSGQLVWMSPGMAGVGFGSMAAVKHGETSSLTRYVIDGVIKVPDIASTAAMAVLQDYGIGGGTSTGLNLVASLSIAAKHNKVSTSVVTVIADNAKYYTSSYLDRSWISKHFTAHGGLQAYDCWKEVVHKTIEYAQDPLDPLTNPCLLMST